MQARYRTAIETWGSTEHRIISVTEQTEEGFFTLLGFKKPSDAEAGRPCFGVSDVVEFEVFDNAEQD